LRAAITIPLADRSIQPVQIKVLFRRRVAAELDGTAVSAASRARQLPFEKWYAFSESPLSENSDDAEIDHGFNIPGIELHRQAELGFLASALNSANNEA